MKRFLSALLALCMLFSIINCSSIMVNASDLTNSGPIAKDLLEEGPKSSPDPTKSDDTVDYEEQETSFDSSGIAHDMLDENEDTCNHGKIAEYVIESDCEKYNSNKHQWITAYVTKCSFCGEILNRYEEKEKENHNFKNGNCIDCGYNAKDCKHEEVERVASYWHTEDNGKYYVEYDLVCTYCKTKVGTSVSNELEPVTKKCTHHQTATKVVSVSYEFSKAEMHLKRTTYKVECIECEEKLNSYTEEIQDKHEIVNSKCIKCGYEISKSNTETFGNNGSSNNKEQTSSNKRTANNEAVESIFISTKQQYLSYYALNDKSVKWENVPIEENGTLQVPLREFSEIMGWEVIWDSTKNLAYVKDGTLIKTFIPNYDVYMLMSNGREIGVNLKNKSKIIDGVFYVDLEGMLESTRYSYYKADTMYYIAEHQIIIDRVSKDKATGSNSLTTSGSVYDSIDYLWAFEEANKSLYLALHDDSYYATVIVPMSEQGMLGNYYDGEYTVEGVLCRILVCELPGTGTVADIQDLAYDIENWKNSIVHYANTALDFIGIIPLIGATKNIPELIDALKNADNVADATKNIKGVKVVTNLTSHTDNVVDSAKAVERTADVAKASISSVSDLSRLTKKGSIWTDDLLKHVFYGNSAGGFHYKGLKGANGEIKTITKAPNKYGVYEAEVKIFGKTKKGKTFFPDNWTPQQVIDAVEEAFEKGNYDSLKNCKIHTMKSGMKIQVNLNEASEVVSAFPLYD